ncbi:unnamed protein product [Medioppia subpectinata]|uniref:Caspase-3 n=1 Tax=Medioppia subpectinata TaxID=1979941 RepID=A0A7R9KM51_9ACAR|nr:unnamed protein product [Medioppia subpectinata]CAG2104918.1 unnamed protein product [Medioppia subpectinata]
MAAQSGAEAEVSGDNEMHTNGGEDANDAIHPSPSATTSRVGNGSAAEPPPEYGVLNIHEESIDYDMKHKSFGKCIILNHEFFKRTDVCPQRKGSSADANNLFQCFTNIGFDVKMKNDMDCQQLFQYMSSVSKEDHSDNDCFVCCILTHGTNDSLWAYDQLYSFESILSFFTGDNCKSLAAKPKIFIIQACRGAKYDAGVDVKVPTDVCDSGNGCKIVKIPAYADFLIAYSAFSGLYSWRNTLEGSWFINFFTKVVNQYHKNMDLLSMLTIINQKVAYNCASMTKEEADNGKKQVGCITHTLTRRIFFAPKEHSSRSTYL